MSAAPAPCARRGRRAIVWAYARGLGAGPPPRGFSVSGHSKWHNIKIKKGKVDQQRGKLFSKLGREIIIAAKHGGGDPSGNMRLRAAIDRAREASMPNDNISRAVARGAGGAEGENYEEATYEGMGPGGVAVLIEVQTDNRNRTVSEIRNVLT